MSGLGEKIKEVFTGHHHDNSSSHSSDVKTPDVNKTPGAYPQDDTTHTHNKLTKDAPEDLTSSSTAHKSNRDSAIGITSPTTTTHQHQHGHVDPETQAKQATSAAGNYPYWGDLPREQEREANPESTHTHLHTHSHITTGAGGIPNTDNIQQHRSTTGDDHSGLDKGALAGAAAAGGAGYLTNRNEKTKPHDALTSSSSPTTTRDTTTTAPMTSSFQENLPDRTTAKPTEADNASTAAQVDPLEYPPKYNQGHGVSKDNSRRNEELAGVGVLGAAGAGYLAHRKHDDDKKERELEKKANPTTATTSTTTSQTSKPISTIDQQRYTADPVPTAQQIPGNASSLKQDPQSTGQYHDYKKEEALAGGVGALGLGAGAGYLASRHNQNENDARRQEEARPSTIAPSSVQRETTAGGIHPTNPSGGIHNTVVGAGSPEDTNARRFPLDNSHSTTVGPQQGATSTDNFGQRDVSGAPKSHDDRDKQALAAAAGVGAGAGLVGAERHHHHNKDNTAASATPQETTAYHGTPAAAPSTGSLSRQQPQQPATAAAQQAWSKQDPVTAGAGYGQPHDNDHDHDRLKYGVPGAGALAGAGATAAYYGRGKEHDQNPQSQESNRIADRALGGSGSQPASTGGSHYSGVDNSSSSSNFGHAPAMGNVGTVSGAIGGGHHLPDCAKVVHKCHQCGAENDISDYVNKASSRFSS